MAKSLIPNNKEMDLIQICDICKSKVNEPVIYGDMISHSNITVHYFCLLLSTNLQQKGRDTGGILGFLMSDIKKEIKAAETRPCIYCNEMGASLKCNTCNKYFHLTCGSIRYCQNEFIDEFKSYCHKHIQVKTNKKCEWDTMCRICYNYMNNFNPINSIMANCCNNGWVHSLCLKKYALNAGYYMKCLWCKDPIFRDQIRRQGIFVPDRDATWELDKNNFAGLYENYLKCDADICLCPYGRHNTKNKYDKKWQIQVCNTCGSFGVHKLCSGQTFDQFTCNNCINVFHTTIVTNHVPTYRSLTASYLVINTPLNNSENQGSLDKTLYLPKLIQDTYDSDMEPNFLNYSEDVNNKPLQKLLKWHPTKNEVEAVVLAFIDNPGKDEFDDTDLTIIREVRRNDYPINKELILECYREVLEENNKEKLMNGAGTEILVEDSDEEYEKTISDLLAEIQNSLTEIQIPKPIIKK